MKKLMTALVICVVVMVVYSQNCQKRVDQKDMCTLYQLGCSKAPEQHNFGKMYTPNYAKISQQYDAISMSQKWSDFWRKFWNSRMLLAGLFLMSPLFWYWVDAKKLTGWRVFLLLLIWFCVSLSTYLFIKFSVYKNGELSKLNDALEKAGIREKAKFEWIWY